MTHLDLTQAASPQRQAVIHAEVAVNLPSRSPETFDFAVHGTHDAENQVNFEETANSCREEDEQVDDRRSSGIAL